MKAVVDADSDRIVGFAALSPRQGELMGTVQAAMLGGQPYPI
jgi:pyruvate/2-oxoglutarate dehydrogenase complex dihydrolipoamide dehydrogenase (E3) component